MAAYRPKVKDALLARIIDEVMAHYQIDLDNVLSLFFNTDIQVLSAKTRYLRGKELITFYHLQKGSDGHWELSQ